MFLAIAVSCTHTDQRLIKADDIMEEHPDSSYMILTGIDTATLPREENRALYALLMTKAMVKNDVKISSDSLISASKTYYESSNNPKYKMQALFYLSYVNHYNLKRDGQLENAIEAYSLAYELNDPLWIARTTELIADIYSSNHNHKEAYQHYKEAEEYYAKAQKDLSSLFSRLDALYRNTDMLLDIDSVKLRECIDSVLQIRNLCRTDEEKVYLLSNCDRLLIWQYIRLNDLDKAEFYINEMEEMNLWRLRPENPQRFLYPFSIAVERNDLIRAEEILNSSSFVKDNPRDSLLFTIYTADLLNRQGRYKEAYDSLYSAYLQLNRESREALKDSPTVQHRDYLSRLSEQQKKYNNDLRILIILIASISAITILLLIIYLRSRSKIFALEKERMSDEVIAMKEILDTLKKRHEDLEQESSSKAIALASYEEKTRQLQEMLQSSDYSASQMSITIENLFQENGKHISVLCGVLSDIISNNYISNDSKENKIIIANLKRMFAEFSKPKYFNTYEEMANRYMNNIMGRIREQCPNINEKDLNYICLYYAGFTTKAISILLDVDFKYCYTKKSRIIKSFENSGARDKEEFIDKLK